MKSNHIRKCAAGLVPLCLTLVLVGLLACAALAQEETTTMTSTTNMTTATSAECPNDDFEDNNERASATVYAANKRRLDAELCEEDEDWYRLRLCEKGKLTITARTEVLFFGSLKMELQDSGGRVLVRDPSRSGSVAYTNNRNQKVTLFLRVRGTHDTHEGQYTLKRTVSCPNDRDRDRTTTRRSTPPSPPDANADSEDGAFGTSTGSTSAGAIAGAVVGAIAFIIGVSVIALCTGFCRWGHKVQTTHETVRSSTDWPDDDSRGGPVSPSLHTQNPLFQLSASEDNHSGRSSRSSSHGSNSSDGGITGQHERERDHGHEKEEVGEAEEYTPETLHLRSNDPDRLENKAQAAASQSADVPRDEYNPPLAFVSTEQPMSFRNSTSTGSPAVDDGKDKGSKRTRAGKERRKDHNRPLTFTAAEEPTSSFRNSTSAGSPAVDDGKDKGDKRTRAGKERRKNHNRPLTFTAAEEPTDSSTPPTRHEGTARPDKNAEAAQQPRNGGRRKDHEPPGVCDDDEPRLMDGGEREDSTDRSKNTLPQSQHSTSESNPATDKLSTNIEPEGGSGDINDTTSLGSQQYADEDDHRTKDSKPEEQAEAQGPNADSPAAPDSGKLANSEGGDSDDGGEHAANTASDEESGATEDAAGFGRLGQLQRFDRPVCQFVRTPANQLHVTLVCRSQMLLHVEGDTSHQQHVLLLVDRSKLAAATAPTVDVAMCQWLETHGSKLASFDVACFNESVSRVHVPRKHSKFADSLRNHKPSGTVDFSALNSFVVGYLKELTEASARDPKVQHMLNLVVFSSSGGNEKQRLSHDLLHDLRCRSAEFQHASKAGNAVNTLVLGISTEHACTTTFAITEALQPTQRSLFFAEGEDVTELAESTRRELEKLGSRLEQCLKEPDLRATVYAQGSDGIAFPLELHMRSLLESSGMAPKRTIGKAKATSTASFHYGDCVLRPRQLPSTLSSCSMDMQNKPVVGVYPELLDLDYLAGQDELTVRIALFLDYVQSTVKEAAGVIEAQATIGDAAGQHGTMSAGRIADGSSQAPPETSDRAIKELYEPIMELSKSVPMELASEASGRYASDVKEMAENVWSCYKTHRARPQDTAAWVNLLAALYNSHPPVPPTPRPKRIIIGDLKRKDDGTFVAPLRTAPKKFQSMARHTPNRDNQE